MAPGGDPAAGAGKRSRRRLPPRNRPETYMSLTTKKNVPAPESWGGQWWTSVGIRCANGRHWVDIGWTFGGHSVDIGWLSGGFLKPFGGWEAKERNRLYSPPGRGLTWVKTIHDVKERYFISVVHKRTKKEHKPVRGVCQWGAPINRKSAHGPRAAPDGPRRVKPCNAMI